MKSNWIILSVVSAVLLSSLMIYKCGRLSGSEVSKITWKYSEGFHLGDFPKFNIKDLKGDTILVNNQSLAIINSCNYGLFRRDAVLEIESLETGEKGSYIEKCGP